MKILETEFVENADKRGDNRFVQIKRNQYAAIYRRFTMDGKPREFEVFQIKVAGGNEIFGKFYEEYEAYPGAAAFGKTAWSVPTEDSANRIFDEITRGEGKRKDGVVETPKPVKVVSVGPKRGRGKRAAVRPAVVFPAGKWNMKELAKANAKGWTKPSLYIAVQGMLKDKSVVEVERKSTGRGRATVFYKKKA